MEAEEVLVSFRGLCRHSASRMQLKLVSHGVGGRPDGAGQTVFLASARSWRRLVTTLISRQSESTRKAGSLPTTLS